MSSILQGELLIETQEFISEKFRSGILAPIKQKLKVEVKKEGGEEDEVEVEYHGMDTLVYCII